MRAELNIDTQEIIREITSEVIKAIKPLLNGKAEDDTIYTVKTLAEYIGVSSQWVYERVHLKEIPYIKMGKFPRFKKADIDKWLDSLKTPAVNYLSRPLKAVK
ncbi:MAG: hypothetical protein A3K22_04510 [Deltaproteobacteria bacterium RBG_16_42_7]|nr:MAG: hypothetical protein A3K22_04510 [Deltaproteobacteria bacterium RBG_16_42_7]